MSLCVCMCVRESVCVGEGLLLPVPSPSGFSQNFRSTSDQCAHAAVTDIDARLVVGEQWIIDPAHVTAALDGHRGVAAVAEQGLAFLRSLAVAEANRVSWWARFGQPWCTSLRPRSQACMPSVPRAVCRCR